MKWTSLVFFAGLCLSCAQNDQKQPIVPALFGKGVLSTKEHNESINAILSKEGVLFLTRADKQYNTSKIMTSHLVNDVWSEPTVVGFSGEFYDAGLTFSPDDQIAFFTSKRPTQNDTITDEWNLWQTSFDRTSSRWETPKLLPFGINTDASECCLIMNDIGSVYFASDRDGIWDIFQATYIDGNYDDIKKTSELSTKKGEWPSFINTTGKKLLFSSIRSSGYGGDDIYYARRIGNQWGPPDLLDSIVNSK